MIKVNPLKAIFLILLCPTKFVRLSVEHDVAAEFETNQQLLATYPNRQLPPDRVRHFEDNALDRTKKIRNAFFAALLSTTAAILFGYVSGYCVGLVTRKASPWVLSGLQIAAAGIILSATLSLLGWEIQSWKGRSFPEQVNRWLFRAQYWLGTFLFVFSIGLADALQTAPR